MHRDDALHVRLFTGQYAGLSKTVVEMRSGQDIAAGIRCAYGALMGCSPEVVKQQAAPEGIAFEVVVGRHVLHRALIR